MAKFRNSFKRRPWETKVQKRERNFQEAGVILKHRTEQILAVAATGRDGYYLSQFLATRKKALLCKHKILVPQPVKEETWAEYFNLKFYRFQRWLRSLWAAAGLGRPGLLMTMDRLREGGRHEIITH